MSTRYAVLASDANLAYAFHLPLTAAIWASMGWTPHVTLVGVTDEDWDSPRHELILRNLNAVPGSGIHVRHIAAIRGFKSSTTAQCSRLLTHLWPHIKDNDVLLTSDADMWPCDPAYFYFDGRFKIWKFERYSKAYMCYCAGTATQWLDLMGTPGGTMPAVLARMLQDGLGDQFTPEEEWGFDETLLNGKLVTWPGVRTAEVVRRALVGPGKIPDRRMDRSFWWGIPTHFGGLFDAHLPRYTQGADATLVAQILPLFHHLLPARYAWAKVYCKAYLALA